MVVGGAAGRGRWWLFDGVSWGSATVSLASQGGHLSPPHEGVLSLLLCMIKALPWLLMCCGELRAFGDVSVHLCSLMAQDASPIC